MDNYHSVNKMFSGGRRTTKDSMDALNKEYSLDNLQKRFRNKRNSTGGMAKSDED